MAGLITRLILQILCATTICSGAYSYADTTDNFISQKEESTAIALNSRIVRIKFPNGTEKEFVRSAEIPNLLAAVGGWKAIIRPEQHMLNAFVGKEGTEKYREYCFQDGMLRYMSVGKRDYEFDLRKWIAPTNSIVSLWPTAKTRQTDLRNNDIWRAGGRLRFFSRNPNRDALIFVQVALIALFFALYSGCCAVKILFAILSASSFVAVVLTQSRGGLLALLAGMAVMFYFRVRNQISLRIVRWFVLGIIVFCTLAYFGGFSRRIAETTEGRDESTSSRLYMWKEVPRMIFAAPLGWGLWKSGPAYNSWFENPSRMHMTGDLFNDHLSRFVEGGYVFGGLYVFIWVLLLSLGWRYAWLGGSPVPLALFLSYWVAACFNPMLYWKPSLYVPAMAVLALLIWKGFHCDFAAMAKLKRPLVISAVITIIMIGAIAVLAASSGEQDVPLRVAALGRRVVVGQGDPTVWVADDGFVLSGDYYGFPGKELREFYKKYPHAEAMGLVERLEDLPDNVEKLVITGTLCKEFIENADKVDANQVILYSPPFSSREVKSPLRKQYGIKLLTGQYAARLTGDDRTKKKWVHVVPGAELYVPNWPSMVVRRNRVH